MTEAILMMSFTMSSKGLGVVEGVGVGWVVVAVDGLEQGTGADRDVGGVVI